MCRTLSDREAGMARQGEAAMTRAAVGWPLRAMGLLLLTLAACAPPPSNFAPNEGSIAGLAQGNPPTDSRRLAITHRFTLRVPSSETETIQQKHLAECTRLGCIIVSTSIDRSNEGRVNARAAIRIKPESYDAFAAMLAAPPVKITMHSQAAEDLAVPILDAEKRLEAKTVLRDRLTAMLRDQTVKTAADLITIEKELAQAQGEIETIVAQRDNLRTRTDTMRVDIFYAGAAGQFGGVDLTPIHQAISGIGQTVVSSVSWLISFLAALVPWLPVIAFFWWVGRRGIHRWRARRVQA
jgi:hypothetical protein